VFEVVFLLAADIDVQACYERFENERVGRGVEFLRRLRGLERLLAENPEMGAKVGRGIRKLLLLRFDHGIFYSVEGRRIIVAAVLDLRRDPDFIRSRLRL
jgi:plasmid stabilization system protein ParE